MRDPPNLGLGGQAAVDEISAGGRGYRVDSGQAIETGTELYGTSTGPRANRRLYLTLRRHQDQPGKARPASMLQRRPESGILDQTFQANLRFTR